MRILLIILMVAIVLPARVPVLAQQRADVGASTVAPPPAPAATMQQGGGMSLDRAVEQVRRQCNGRIVSAETVVNGGRETHVIKCLTGDGKVRTFRIPGRRV